MSQSDDKAGQSKTTPAATKTTKPTAQPGAKKASKGDNLWILGVFLVLLAGATVTLLMRGGNDTPRPVVNADEEAVPVADEAEMVESDPATESAEEEPATETESSADVATGALTITSDVRGADVYLNGKRVGVTPHKATPLSPGSYKVRVVQSGYETFETSVEVTAKSHTLKADLKRKAAAATTAFTVDSNVSGATVTLDGQERGTTPVEIENLGAGTYELVVSAAGYKTHSETVEYGGGARDIRVDLESATIVLNEAVAVKHKHRLGGCEGVLRASADGIRFETDHKDAFFVAFSNLAQLNFDDDTLSVKVEGGRNYNFVERNDNPDALARFHEQVDSAVGN